MTPARTRRLLIIGWDGADWEIVNDLIERGDLPNVGRMIEEGAAGNLDSTTPSHSWAAWSTFLTGMNPGSHGVFDFVERDPKEPRRRIPVSSRSIKTPTFFERLSEAGHEVRLGNIPVTFPPTPVRGRIIAGVTVPPGSSFVYPEEWAAELRERAPFPVNGMEWTRFRDDPEALAREAKGLVERRTDSFECLLGGKWKVATCVYVAPDRLQHPLASYLMPSHPDYPRLVDGTTARAVRDVYRTLDSSIERLRVAAGTDATVMLMSDHGFRPIDRACNLGAVLNELGFSASLRSTTARNAVLRSSIVGTIAKRRVGQALKKRLRSPSRIDWKATVAYESALGFGVSVNLKGREPDGIVDPKDYEKVLGEVHDALLNFTEAGTSERPVGFVARKEDLYKGSYRGLAPDLIVESNPLWAFSRLHQPTERIDWPSGTHRRRGILIAHGNGIERGSLGDRHIADIAPTALAFSGTALGPDLEGEVIEEIAGTTAPTAVLASNTFADGDPKDSSQGLTELTQEEQESISSHLRSLGYIE